MFTHFKAKVRSEWNFKPLKQTVIGLLALIIVAATVFLIAKFGWIVGGLFFVLMLFISHVLSEKGI